MSNRRRRPSKSSKANPLKWVLIVGAVLLLLGFFGIFAVMFGVNSWLHGDGFRAWAKKKTATLLKAEVAIEKLEWEDSQVYLDGFKAEGYNDSSFAKLELDGVRATFDGISEGAWQIPGTTVNRMNMEFSQNRLQGVFERHSMVHSESDGKSAAPEWVRKFLPERAEIGAIDVDSTNVVAKDKAGTQVFALQSVSTRIKPDFESGMWDFSGRGGKLIVPQVPPFDVQSFGVRWQRKDLYITSLALNFLDGAHLSGTGDILFGDQLALNLDLNLDGLDLHKVIQDEQVKERVKGIVSGPIKISGTPGSEEGLKQSGTISIKDGVLSNLPVLDTIAKYTRAVQFKRLGLNQAKADFERVGDRILLTNIEIQSDGLTRVEGNLLLEGDTIAGEFQLGVTAGTLRWIPGADRKVFVTQRDGFLWTPLKITGTRSDINEDLTIRLIAAAGEAFVEDLPKNVIEKARESVKNPTEAPSSLIDDGVKILNGLVPLLGQ